MNSINNARYQFAARIALAVAVSMTLTQWLHLEEVYWAGISAAVVASFNEVGHVASKAKQRIAGTICGCLIWGVISFFFPSYGSIYLLTLVLIASLGFSNAKLDLRYSYFWLYGSFTFLVFSTPLGIPNNLIVPLHIARIYEIVIGSVIGLATHWLSFSYRASKELDTLWKNYQHQFEDFICSTYSDLKAKNYGNQNSLLIEVSQMLASAKKLENKIASANLEKKHPHYLIKIRLCRHVEHYLYGLNHLLNSLPEPNSSQQISGSEISAHEKAILKTIIQSLFANNTLSKSKTAEISKAIKEELSNGNPQLEQFWHQTLGFFHNVTHSNEPEKFHQRKWTKEITRFEYINALRWSLIVVSLPLLWLFLGYQPNLQLAVTAMLVLMYSESNNIVKTKHRLVGAAAGFLLAIPALAMIHGNTFVYFVMILVVSFALESIFYEAKRNYIALQGVICFIIGLGSDSHLDASMSRVIGIFFGIVLTLIIIKWIWPKNINREKEVIQGQVKYVLSQYLYAVKQNLIENYLFSHNKTLTSYWHWQIEHDLNQLKKVDAKQASAYINLYNQLSHSAFTHSSPLQQQHVSKGEFWKHLHDLYEIQKTLC
ncbi:FUSC family protein [Vibrio marisflavi]|nr:FUSC family protein [Vibrio marisflavi]